MSKQGGAGGGGTINGSMTKIIPSLAQLVPNEDWAALPLFDRSGWRRVRFGDFAQSVNERVEPADAAEEIYVGLDDLDSRSLHIRRWGKGSDVTGTKLRFQKDDIIFGRRRAYQRKLAVAEFEGICSAHAMVVRAKPEMVLPEFLPFLMMSDRFMNRAVEISVGSLSPTINWTTLKLESFDLPPLDQQNRLAEVLWSTDDVIAKNRSLLLVQTSALRAAFESHTETPSQNNWPLVPLESVVARFIDYRGKTPNKTAYGTPLITAKNVRTGYLSEEPREFIADEDYVSWMRRGFPTSLDILFTTEAPLGKIALVPSYRFALAQRIICLSPDSKKVDHRFFFWGMQSATVQRRIRQAANGTTVLGIKQSNLRKILFPVPDLQTQRKVSSLCDLLAALSTSVEEHIQTLEKLRFGLINILFAAP